MLHRLSVGMLMVLLNGGGGLDGSMPCVANSALRLLV
jgi:hypothetical protein